MSAFDRAYIKLTCEIIRIISDVADDLPVEVGDLVVLFDLSLRLYESNDEAHIKKSEMKVSSNDDSNSIISCLLYEIRERDLLIAELEQKLKESK